MAIRIYSKKAFAIGPGAQRGTPEIECFITVPGAFQDMPDKYVNDPTYKLAVKAGEITLISGADSAKRAEESELVIEDKASMSALDLFREELKVMKKAETLQLGEQYDVKPREGEKMSAFKDRVFEAYKLAHPEEA